MKHHAVLAATMLLIALLAGCEVGVESPPAPRITPIGAADEPLASLEPPSADATPRQALSDQLAINNPPALNNPPAINEQPALTEQPPPGAPLAQQPPLEQPRTVVDQPPQTDPQPEAQWQYVQQPAKPPRQSRQPGGEYRVARGNLRFVDNYRQGYEKALREGKPMLVFFTAEWCHYCHEMADEAFTHPQVVSLARYFVCILIDADVEPDVCRQFRVTGFPTIQFLSPRGGLMERIVGKKPSQQLAMSMQATLQSIARRDEEPSDTPPR
jgi:thiol-disulfide isomerase/thioredoxin